MSGVKPVDRVVQTSDRLGGKYNEGTRRRVGGDLEDAAERGCALLRGEHEGLVAFIPDGDGPRTVADDVGRPIRRHLGETGAVGGEKVDEFAAAEVKADE